MSPHTAVEIILYRSKQLKNGLKKNDVNTPIQKLLHSGQSRGFLI